MFLCSPAPLFPIEFWVRIVHAFLKTKTTNECQARVLVNHVHVIF